MGGRQVDAAAEAARDGLAAKVMDREAAQRVRRALASQGRRVVLTNGVFDLLHAGHVQYLATARALGDALFVGLNEDESVRRNKGPVRPVQPLADWALVLAGLAAVDAVVPFGEDTAEALVAALRPDVYVKGADYAVDGGDGKPLPEAALVRGWGGEVHLVPYRPGRSTTELIRRVVASSAR